MKILAIETSCDETSVAILEDNKILSNIISSQVKIHAQWGGVVPNLAAREHIKNIIPVLEKALKKSKTTLKEIDLFAVTQGPGLIPALLIGVNVAKTLAWFYNKPLIGIHHIEGHILVAFADENLKFEIQNSNFPALALVVSGGHTQLVYMAKPLNYQIIGQTQDDAVGEAFDKVAKIMDLGYPGGPIVSQLAQNYKSDSSQSKIESQKPKIVLPRPMISSGDFNFSFSGLKTAVLYGWQKSKENCSSSEIKKLQAQICFSFQEAAVEVLVKKTIKAAQKHQPKTILLVGGVAANQQLRETLKREIAKQLDRVDFLVPPLTLCGDNATMIGVAAHQRFLQKKITSQEKGNWKNLEAKANWELGVGR